mgnify:CR=1 FL=1
MTVAVAPTGSGPRPSDASPDASGDSAAELSVVEFTEREGRRPTDRSRHRTFWLALLAAIGLWSFGDAVARPELINPGGWSLVTKFFGAITRPELSGDFIEVVARASATTAA